MVLPPTVRPNNGNIGAWSRERFIEVDDFTDFIEIERIIREYYGFS